MLEQLPDAPTSEPPEGGPRRVALIGRPNVGKSSLLNRLTGEERAVVDSVAGTTIDPVDSLVELDGEVWRFVDTAGLRRRVRQASGMEFYASLRTSARSRPPRSRSCCSTRPSRSASRTSGSSPRSIEAGRALVVAFNKWDLLDEDRREQLEREIERDLARVAWAPRINVSAKTGRAVDRLAPHLRTSLALLGEADLDRAAQRLAQRGRRGHAAAATRRQGAPGAVRDAGRRPSAPVRAVHDRASWRPGTGGSSSGELREDFGFAGTPIEVSIRVREKRGKPS